MARTPAEIVMGIVRSKALSPVFIDTGLKVQQANQSARNFAEKLVEVLTRRGKDVNQAEELRNLIQITSRAEGVDAGALAQTITSLSKQNVIPKSIGPRGGRQSLTDILQGLNRTVPVGGEAQAMGGPLALIPKGARGRMASASSGSAILVGPAAQAALPEAATGQNLLAQILGNRKAGRSGEIMNVIASRVPVNPAMNGAANPAYAGGMPSGPAGALPSGTTETPWGMKSPTPVGEVNPMGTGIRGTTNPKLVGAATTGVGMKQGIKSITDFLKKPGMKAGLASAVASQVLLSLLQSEVDRQTQRYQMEQAESRITPEAAYREQMMPAVDQRLQMSQAALMGQYGQVPMTASGEQLIGL